MQAHFKEAHSLYLLKCGFFLKLRADQSTSNFIARYNFIFEVAAASLKYLVFALFCFKHDLQFLLLIKVKERSC